MNIVNFAVKLFGEAFSTELLTKSLFAWLGIFAVTAIIVIAMVLLGLIKSKDNKK